jgi:hypothetical protein
VTLFLEDSIFSCPAGGFLCPSQHAIRKAKECSLQSRAELDLILSSGPDFDLVSSWGWLLNLSGYLVSFMEKIIVCDIMELLCQLIP